MKTLLTFTLLFLISICNAQFLGKEGPQIFTFHSDVDDTEQPYAIYIPKNYSPKKTYPLVVMLHGAGSNHRLALKRVFGKSNNLGENDVEASLVFPKFKDVPYIVISPNARGTMGYQGVAEKDVWDMIADVKSKFLIDENRTYLTGLSMGGGGTMWIGLTRPDFWAAIAPVCPAPPANTISYLPNVNGMPVHFFQGSDDPAVKAENTRKWVDDFKKAGAQVSYIEYPGVKHDSWVNAYKNTSIFDWFENKKRNIYPDKVVFQTEQLKYSKAYWVSLVDIEPNKLAKIEADFSTKNSLKINTQNINAFKVDILNHPKFSKKGQFMLVIDGQSLPVYTLNNDQVLLKTDKKWAVARKPDYTNVKNQITEGPMTEIGADRHIYVYGTAGNPSKEELESRKKIAEEAANWSAYRGDFLGRVMVFPRVLSDVEVRKNDFERSSLVLFGDVKTNTIIQKYATDLPLQLKESKSKDASLVYIMPIGNKYALINSGLPFWEIPPPGGSSNPMARLGSKIGALNGYGDYVLFDKSNNKVLATGYFNKGWGLNPTVLSEIYGTGFLQVK
jgi:poly(3-hydroxybutyrate) depolymerase